MKVPDKIETLHELSKWVIKNEPKVIEITKGGGLRKIGEFLEWKFYRGIPVKHI